MHIECNYWKIPTNNTFCVKWTAVRFCGKACVLAEYSARRLDRRSLFSISSSGERPLSPQHLMKDWSHLCDDFSGSCEQIALKYVAVSYERITMQVESQEISVINPSRAIASASMLDTEYFLLYDSDSYVIWRCFNNPTNTILPC